MDCVQALAKARIKAISSPLVELNLRGCVLRQGRRSIVRTLQAMATVGCSLDAATLNACQRASRERFDDRFLRLHHILNSSSSTLYLVKEKAGDKEFCAKVFPRKALSEVDCEAILASVVVLEKVCLLLHGCIIIKLWHFCACRCTSIPMWFTSTKPSWRQTKWSCFLKCFMETASFPT
jgi:hypothetical protein